MKPFVRRASIGAGLAIACAFLGAAPATQAGGGITLTYTVQADPTPNDPMDDGGLCEEVETRAEVARGFKAIYCFEVTNNAGATLNRHDLDDSQLGKVLEDFPFNLVDGASAYITQFPVMKETTKSTAVWTAGSSTRVEISSPASVKVKVLTCPGEKDDMRTHVIGTDESDSLQAPDAGAVMCGLGGKDDLFGGAGKDLIYGGEGKDTIDAGGGKDTCYLDRKDDAINCEKEKKA